MSSIKIELRQEDVTKIQEICASFNKDPQELINVLHGCQQHFGYLPAEVQEVISSELGIPVAKIYGVVTFYSFFTMTPKGRHPISICMGTACYVRGAEKVLDEFKKRTKPPGRSDNPRRQILAFEPPVRGCMRTGPVVLVGDKTYGRVAPDDVKNILKEYE